MLEKNEYCFNKYLIRFIFFKPVALLIFLHT